MPELEYTNRELDEKFGHISDLITEKNKDIMSTLARIENQTTKTNGRVSKLETFRNVFSGALSIMTVVIVPIFGWMLYQVAMLPNTVQEAVAQALLPYAK